MATFTKTVDAPKKSTGGTLRGGKSTPYGLCRTKKQNLSNCSKMLTRKVMSRRTE